jgi:hypothetical protein
MRNGFGFKVNRISKSLFTVLAQRFYASGKTRLFPFCDNGFPGSYIENAICMRSLNMACSFQSLYFADDAYVVRCKECNHYQLGYLSVMLTLSDAAYRDFRQVVYTRKKENSGLAPHCKNQVIQTPGKGVCLLFTPLEIRRLYDILDEADTEERVLALIGLFR